MSCLSAPLNELVNRGSGESSDVSVAWKDVDRDVFSRFVQFAYTGVYTGFSPSENDDSSEGATETANVVEKQLDTMSNGLFLDPPPLRGDPFKLPYSLASYEKATKDIPFGTSRLICQQGISSKKRDFISAFVAKQGGLEYASSRKADLTFPTGFLEAVLLGHAKTWVFANAYAISTLMSHAHSHLAHELAHWTISPATFLYELGGLVQYIYDQTVTRSQLRLLIVEFVACVVEDVSNLEGWPTLLKDVPDFAADLLDQMTNRLG